MSTTDQISPAFVQHGTTPTVVTLDLNGNPVVANVAGTSGPPDLSGEQALSILGTYPAPAALQDLSQGKTNQLDPSQVKGATGYASLAAQLAAMQTQIQNLGAGGGGGSAPTVTTPTIAGTKTVGSTLTATPGTVTTSGGHASSSNYQWNRESPTSPRAAIPGATAVTYGLAAADLGFFISFTQTPIDTVTGSTGAAATSALTAVIIGTTPTNSVAPTISPSGSQVSGTVLTLNNGTWANAATFTYQYYDNGVPVGALRSAIATYTPGALQVGHTITGDVLGISSLGIPAAAAVPTSNSITVTGAAQTVLNTLVPTLSGTTSGGGVGIIQADAVDTAGAAVTLANALPKTVTNGNFRMELVAPSTAVAITSDVASPNAVSWAQFAVTDGTGGNLPNSIQAWHPAAYTNLDTSVLSSFASSNAIKFFLESDIIDGSFGLLAGVIGFAATNPGFTFASPSVTGLTGDLVLVEAVYTGGGINQGFSNGGDNTRIPLSGTGITSGHHSNTVDGDDMYVQYRTVLAATAGQSFSAAGAFPGSGGGAESAYSMILAFRKKAGGAGNNIQQGQSYTIAPATWTVNGVVTAPTTRTWTYFRSTDGGATYQQFGAPTSSNVAVIDPVNFVTTPTATLLKVVETGVFSGVAYTTSLTGATVYTTIAAAATLTAILNNATLAFTSGSAISPVIPVGVTGGSGTLSCAVSPLIPGLTCNPGTGALTGTPTTVGQANYMFTWSDTGGDTPSSQVVNISIQSSVVITALSSLIASIPFAQQSGGIQWAGGGWNVSQVPDTIGVGFPGGVAGATASAGNINGNSSRLAKFLDPLGGGFTCIREAISSSDPIDHNAGVHRCDVALSNWPGLNQGNTGWIVVRAMFPSGVFNVAGMYMTIFDFHGSTDGGFYFALRSGADAVLFQVVRNSQNSYTNYQIVNGVNLAGGANNPFQANQWCTIVIRVRMDSTGVASLSQLWKDGTLLVNTTEINATTSLGFPYYPKVAAYDGGVALPASGGWWYYTSIQYFLDNAQQFTEPQMRAKAL